MSLWGSPTPAFPLFVLIADERCFMQCDDERALNWFEQADLEDMDHWAWDARGRKYKLEWKDKAGTIARLVAENGAGELRLAVGDYLKRLGAAGVRTPVHGRCDGATLHSLLESIDRIFP